MYSFVTVQSSSLISLSWLQCIQTYTNTYCIHACWELAKGVWGSVNFTVGVTVKPCACAKKILTWRWSGRKELQTKINPTLVISWRCCTEIGHAGAVNGSALSSPHYYITSRWLQLYRQGQGQWSPIKLPPPPIHRRSSGKGWDEYKKMDVFLPTNYSPPPIGLMLLLGQTINTTLGWLLTVWKLNESAAWMHTVGEKERRDRRKGGTYKVKKLAFFHLIYYGWNCCVQFIINLFFVLFS